MCSNLDPAAVPAFPVTSSQVADINTLSTGVYLFTGAWRAHGDVAGEFTDVSGSGSTTLESARYWDDAAQAYTGESCVVTGYGQLFITPCGGLMGGVVCQVSAAPPEA